MLPGGRSRRSTTGRWWAAAVGAVALAGCQIGSGLGARDLTQATADELGDALIGDGAQVVTILHAVASEKRREAWAAFRSRHGEACIAHLVVTDEGGERTDDCRLEALGDREIEELVRDLVPPDQRLIVFRVGADVDEVSIPVDDELLAVPVTIAGGERVAWAIVSGAIGRPSASG